MFGMPSIKREGQTMLNMCMEQCEGVYLMNEIERLREEVDELVKERNRYKRVCLKIVGDSKEESDISDFVLYLAKEALKEGE